MERDATERHRTDGVGYFVGKPLLLPIIDHVLVVHAPKEIRIECVMARDNVSGTGVATYFNQWSDSRRLEMADFSIEKMIAIPLSQKSWKLLK